MSSCRHWTAALAGVLLLTNSAVCAEPMAEAYLKGKSCLEKGDYDKAIVDYTEAIRLNPRFADAYLDRAGCYWRKGEKAKAEADFAEYKKLRKKGSGGARETHHKRP